MIDYIAGVLNTIKFITGVVSVSGGVLFLMAYVFNMFEQKTNYIPKLINIKPLMITFIICLLLTIFIPSNLNYQVAKKEMEENAKLQSKIIKMEYLIQKYELQHNLKQLEEE